MSCEGNVCGTGGWNGPLPGDPDNNVTLHANTVFGGVTVNWSYPSTNPAAVAHTQLYRGTVNDYSKAVQLGVVGGSIFFDKLSPTVPTTYYYWIRIVSVNGTVMDPIGPASAVADVPGQQTLESLTGMIDAGVLAESLKTSIAGITQNNDALKQEILDRLYANQGFADAMKQVQDGLQQSMTYIMQEVKARQDGDNASVDAINIIAAANNQALAAIDEEKTVRVGQNSAMAQQITSLITTVGNTTSGLVHDLSVTTTTAQGAARDVTKLFTTVGDSKSGIIHDMNSLNTAIGNVASDVTTVESTLNGNTATGQVGLITTVGNINIATNKNATDLSGFGTTLGKIGALYTAKVQVNGLIGGFGVYNDGTSVQAGFDVDTFWVGRTDVNGTKVKPFIVSGGNVYMSQAFIQNASVGTLQLAGNSVMVGTYGEAGANSVSAGGTTTLISRTLNLGDGNNSGLIVSAAVSATNGDSASVGFRIRINGNIVGDQRASLQGGYAYLFPVSGFGFPGSAVATVTLEAYSADGKSFSINSSAMSIMGGKR